ncbi:MAG TPA: PDZ domain-containing protein [Acidimicrobiales bacterium]|nr:PDZ domain-containing protein [Acidimicrobiales bacterium]
MKVRPTSRRHVKARVPNSNGHADRRRRLTRVGAATCAFIVVLLVCASFITVPYEAITPGSTFDVSHLITLPSGIRHADSGSVSLVDVDLVPLRAIDYLFFRFNPDNQIVPTGEILGANTQSTVDEQGLLDMVSAQQAATYVAFQQLGYSIRAQQERVVVYDLLPRSPAALGSSRVSLRVGDIICKFDGDVITSVASLRRSIIHHRVGDRVTIEVERYGQSRMHSVQLRLGALSSKRSGVEVCSVSSASMAQAFRRDAPCLGVVLMPIYHLGNMPFVVKLSAGGIIGPSAGLAFTLGIIRDLDRLSLTNGLSVAATGTIAMDGSIGDVGGVAQKTIEVRNSKASVFFVPTSEFQVAKSRAGPHLRVFPVTSISQVLRDLHTLGGQILRRVPR